MNSINTFLPYTPPRLLFNAHLETIYPSLFRKVELQPYDRERINTPDGDFLDLDWLRHPTDRLVRNDNPSLVIISHGLEGNSNRAYIKGMARAFYNAGVDILAWNYRGCGDEMNLQPIFYHSGASDDLSTVINHAIDLDQWGNIFLVGFSLGGNMTLKYLGERGGLVPPQIKKAFALSVPMDLVTGCRKISEPSNWLYLRRFLISLKKKISMKAATRSNVDASGIESIKNLLEFDNRYTAPLHGFEDALDYYQKNSANRFVQNITIPTLIVNAKNDPFLTPECSPVESLSNHPSVKLETPERGGHVGFSLFNANGLYWSELRALQFIQP